MARGDEPYPEPLRLLHVLNRRVAGTYLLPTDHGANRRHAEDAGPERLLHAAAEMEARRREGGLQARPQVADWDSGGAPGADFVQRLANEGVHGRQRSSVPNSFGRKEYGIVVRRPEIVRRRGGGRRGADCHRRRRLEGFGEEEYATSAQGREVKWVIRARLPDPFMND